MYLYCNESIPKRQLFSPLSFRVYTIHPHRHTYREHHAHRLPNPVIAHTHRHNILPRLPPAAITPHPPAALTPSRPTHRPIDKHTDPTVREPLTITTASPLERQRTSPPATSITHTHRHITTQPPPYIILTSRQSRTLTAASPLGRHRTSPHAMSITHTHRHATTHSPRNRTPITHKTRYRAHTLPA